MEQPLSVALTVEPFLARPWLPSRSARFFGAASFIRLALRADERHNGRRRAAKLSEAFLRGHATVQNVN
jgi:hypothetical protein